MRVCLVLHVHQPAAASARSKASHVPRADACQEKPAARSRPARAASGSSQAARMAVAAAAASSREVLRNVAPDLPQHRDIRAGDRHPARHGFDHRQPEALAKGGKGHA